MAVTANPLALPAEWGRHYWDDARPARIPDLSRWVGDFAPGTFQTQRFHLEPVFEAQLPPISPATVDAQLGGAILNQYYHGISEYASRGLKARVPGRFYTADWEWVDNPRKGASGPGWILRLSASGEQIINLVAPGGGGRFFDVVDAIVKVGVGVIMGIALTEVGGEIIGAEGTADAAADEAAIAADEAGGAVEGPIDGEAGGAVGGAAGTAGEVGAVAGGAVGANVNDANAAADEVAGAATGGADASLGDSLGTFEDSVGGVLDSIKDTIANVKDFLGNLLGPIADTVHEAAGLVKDINENLIKPITGPITAILDNYKALSTELTRDLHSGITGLLRIPQDIGNALTTIDATMQRTVAILGAQNTELVRSTVVPALHDAGTGAVTSAGKNLGDGLSGYSRSERDNFIGKLTDDPGVEDIAALESKIARLIDESAPWIGKIGGVIMDVITSLTLVFSYIEAKHELYRQIGNRKWPTAELDAVTAIEAWRRKIIDDAALDHELSGHGLAASRIKLLKELARKFPAESDLINWYFRGFLGLDNVEDALELLGWTVEDANRLLEGSYRLPDIGTAIRWARRGIVDADARDALIRAGGIKPDDVAAYVRDALVQPGVADVLAFEDRKGTIAANVAPRSLAQGAPQEVVDALAELGVPPNVAALLWVNHFQLLSPELACVAWFRGYISADMLDSLLAAGGIAQEQRQNFIDLQRPVFTLRNVPQLIKGGVITPDQGRDYLMQAGYQPLDAERMIELTIGKGKAAGTADGNALHGLTVTAVLQLYDAGSVDRAAARSLLIELGFGGEAADLQLTLRDITDEASERKAQADLIIAQAKSGHLTFDDAQIALNGAGLTQLEVRKALAQLERDAIAKNKLPGEAQMIAMYKHGLLTRAAAGEALGRLGYSEGWAELLIQLAELGKASDAGQPGTG